MFGRHWGSNQKPHEVWLEGLANEVNKYLLLNSIWVIFEANENVDWLTLQANKRTDLLSLNHLGSWNKKSLQLKLHFSFNCSYIFWTINSMYNNPEKNMSHHESGDPLAWLSLLNLLTIDSATFPPETRHQFLTSAIAITERPTAWLWQKPLTEAPPMGEPNPPTVRLTMKGAVVHMFFAIPLRAPSNHLYMDLYMGSL